MHPVYNVQDWDSPKGAIDWPRLASFLQHCKTHAGEFTSDHRSHDHLNAVRTGCSFAMPSDNLSSKPRYLLPTTR